MHEQAKISVACVAREVFRNFVATEQPILQDLSIQFRMQKIWRKNCQNKDSRTQDCPIKSVKKILLVPVRTQVPDQNVKVTLTLNGTPSLLLEKQNLRIQRFWYGPLSQMCPHISPYDSMGSDAYTPSPNMVPPGKPCHVLGASDPTQS